jgi:hypothetical protein
VDFGDRDASRVGTNSHQANTEASAPPSRVSRVLFPVGCGWVGDAASVTVPRCSGRVSCAERNGGGSRANRGGGLDAIYADDGSAELRLFVRGWEQFAHERAPCIPKRVPPSPFGRLEDMFRGLMLTTEVMFKPKPTISETDCRCNAR